MIEIRVSVAGLKAGKRAEHITLRSGNDPLGAPGELGNGPYSRNWRYTSAMRNGLWLGIGVLFISSSAAATEYHVAVTGNDTNAGTSAAPWLTLHKAAQTLQAGDICTVHAGTYREQLDPAHSGTSDAARIVYRAAMGEQVFIKGSEQVTAWTQDSGVWKAVVPNTTFGTFNPYSTKISGSYLTYGNNYHLGEVYLDGAPYSEVLTKAEVSATASTWYVEVDATNTTIWANFTKDPTAALAEINVRKYVVAPTVSGIKYITLDGFSISQGSPNWAPPDAPQEGMIELNWGLHWLIQNNQISDGKTVCICGGVVASGGSQDIDKVGNHVIYHNTIERCGEAGIAGSHGMVASVINGNLIQEINPQKHFGGYESAGIKIHSAIDVVIENNIIRNVHANLAAGASHPGIWLDWQGQGSRITSNVIYGIDQSIIELEMDHGPTLVDNNVFVGNDTGDLSEDSIFVHNLFVKNSFSIGATDSRSAGYYTPHTTTQVGEATHSSADNHYFNNIHIDKGLDGVTQAPGYVADFNVFYGGAKKSSWGDMHSLVKSTVVDDFAAKSLPGGVTISFTADSAPRDVAAPLITRDFIGVGTLTKEGIENHDGTPVTIDRDITGAARDATHPSAGPFEQVKAGVNTFTINAGLGAPITNPGNGGSGSAGASSTGGGNPGGGGDPGSAGAVSTGASGAQTSSGGSDSVTGAGGSSDGVAGASGKPGASGSSGCGCRVASSRRSPTPSLALALASLLCIARRRSRRQRAG